MPIQHLRFVADIDECQTRGKNVCSPLERCINTAGSYKCGNQTAAECKLGEQELGGRCIGGLNVLIIYMIKSSSVSKPAYAKLKPVTIIHQSYHSLKPDVFTQQPIINQSKTLLFCHSYIIFFLNVA